MRLATDGATPTGPAQMSNMSSCKFLRNLTCLDLMPGNLGLVSAQLWIGTASRLAGQWGQTCHLDDVTVLFAQRLQAYAGGEPRVQKLSHQFHLPAAIYGIQEHDIVNRAAADRWASHSSWPSGWPETFWQKAYLEYFRAWRGPSRRRTASWHASVRCCRYDSSCKARGSTGQSSKKRWPSTTL